jgi:hypothetical protein
MTMEILPELQKYGEHLAATDQLQAFDLMERVSAELGRLCAIVREIAHNPDCSSASCGIACRIYLGELPEQERPVGSATPSPK